MANVWDRGGFHRGAKQRSALVHLRAMGGFRPEPPRGKVETLFGNFLRDAARDAEIAIVFHRVDVEGGPMNVSTIHRAILEWCAEQRAIYERQLALMEAGTMRTGEHRGGRMVDTTAEMMETAKRRLAELDQLLEQTQS